MERHKNLEQQHHLIIFRTHKFSSEVWSTELKIISFESQYFHWKLFNTHCRCDYLINRIPFFRFHFAEGNDIPISSFSSNDNNNNNNTDRSIASNSLVIGSCSGTASSGNSISHHREHSHSPNIAMNNINRYCCVSADVSHTSTDQ